ncbi:MAG: MopE-related protein [Myxococcota bacterium]
MTFLVAAAGCLEVAAPTGPTSPDVRRIDAPPGSELVATCIPSGLERCFDALDNNCDGIIDEGCGLSTGLIQFTVAWPEAETDVDLDVRGPLESDDPARFVRDRDCPSDGCYGQNVENMFLADGRLRRGVYVVTIRLASAAADRVSEPLAIRLSGRIGQRHYTTEVTLDGKHEERELRFEL